MPRRPCLPFLLLLALGAVLAAGNGGCRKAKPPEIIAPPGGPPGLAELAKTMPLDHPLRVGVNVWVGCVAGLVANGGLTTTPESIFKQKYDLEVEFKIIDDWSTRPAALQKGEIDVNLTTADVFAIERSRYEQNALDVRAILMVDWSRGGDGIVADKSIQQVKDLQGKKIACSQYTPSHYLLLHVLRNAGLSPDDIQAIMKKVTWVNTGTDAANAFASGRVDAAVTWEPDMSDVVAKRENAHVLVSTREADRLIADVLVSSIGFCDRFPDAVEKFVKGWLDGVQYIKDHPDEAATIIGSIPEFNIPADLAQAMLAGVVLSDQQENAAFFGLGSEQPGDFDTIFADAGTIWQEQGVISQVIEAAKAKDTRFLEAAMKADSPTS